MRPRELIAGFKGDNSDAKETGRAQIALPVAYWGAKTEGESGFISRIN